MQVGEGSRERETERDREREREDPKQALCWQQTAWHRARTHKPWDRDLSWSRTRNQLRHPSAPKVYLFLREGERECKLGRTSERETEDLKQALCWQQTAWCGAQTCKLWDHDLSWSQTLSQPTDPLRCPKNALFNKLTSFCVFLKYYQIYYDSLWFFYSLTLI